jgi:predicted secreted protein
MSGALLGYGTIFQTGDGNSPENYVTFAEVAAISMLRFSADSIDTSHELAPGSAREFIAGMRNYGAVQLTFNLIPGSATELALFAEMAAPVTRNRKIVTPDGKTLSFPAFITGHEANEAVGDKLGGSATFQLTGAMTIA